MRTLQGDQMSFVNSNLVTTLRLDVGPRGNGAFARRGEPIACGIPIAKGLLPSPEFVSLLDRRGQPIATQASVTERWNDGSVRWLLLRFAADTDERGRATYDLALDGGPAEDATPAPCVRIDYLPMEIRIDTGALTAAIGRRVEIVVPGERPSRVEPELWDALGRAMDVRFDAPVIEEAGPLYVRVRHAGVALTNTGERALDLSLRLEFFARLPIMQCAIAITNPHPALHPKGYWELGDANSVLLRGVSVRAELPERPDDPCVRYSLGPDEAWQQADAPLLVDQQSSGGEAWASRAHVNAAGEVRLRLRGYEVTSEATSLRGIRATPVVQLQGTRNAIAVTSERFWENFPAAIRADRRSIAFSMFPRRGPALHEIQPGERKTHRFTMLFGNDPVTADTLAWARSPLLARLEPRACLEAEPLPLLVPRGTDRAADALIDQGIAGPHSFFQKREDVDEYGWRHFGDLPADHQASGSKSLVSHSNNEYDAIAGFAAQYLRTADDRWWTLMDDLAAHVADIDVYHARGDGAAYPGSLFGPTWPCTDAGTSTHRSRPSAPGVKGGGPSADHNYSTGLMLHYYLTGRSESREAALGLAEWLMASDSVARPRFAWMLRGSNAHARQASRRHRPDGGTGNSIAVLVNAHRLSGERRFLDKAEELIARSVHPADDIAALNLDQVERHWSYTVFLQAVGRYLLHKYEHDELDAQYAYARACLVHYARWMTQHEYPYLDRPSRLERQTETWSAQDLRKAEIFVFAALCADASERPAFISRAKYFHERSIETLQQSGTSWLTRPLVILLSTSGALPWWQHTAGARSLPESRAVVDVGPWHAPDALATAGGAWVLVTSLLRAVAAIPRLAP